jgi:hypothetical protein
MTSLEALSHAASTRRDLGKRPVSLVDQIRAGRHRHGPNKLPGLGKAVPASSGGAGVARPEQPNR